MSANDPLQSFEQVLKTVADVGADRVQISLPFRNFLIAVAFCVAASICLALAPFVAPEVPLLPFILANWVLCMIVGLVFRRSKVDWISHSESIWWDRLTAFALISYTAAGLFAFSFADRIAR